MFDKILIANRGEIALRILRTCHKLGIGTVAVYSEADADAAHVQKADEAVHIGPALSRKSYLNIEAIVDAARKTGAQAIHPGYGFLSENAVFAQTCRRQGLVFIGPPADAIAAAGNKSEARRSLMEHGIAVIPGSADVLTSPQAALSIAADIGYPVILKASGGGGGRGMRIARDPTELQASFATAAGEAKAGFGTPDLYLEKYIQRPRHIEVQLLADHRGHCIHLGERECSIQHRYQKLIEESPSPAVDDTLRQRIGQTAISIAGIIGYSNAGTVEFLMDENRNTYFMEVNARIQVEHPVTEMVTGIDIVEQQIRIAAGEKLPLTADRVRVNGSAVECRINAADPENQFMPSPGTITDLTVPTGRGVRWDSHIQTGTEISPFYDSLIGKLVTWGPDRRAAIDEMQKALAAFRIEGIQTTIPLHRRIMSDPDFINADIDTHFIERLI